MSVLLKPPPPYRLANHSYGYDLREQIRELARQVEWCAPGFDYSGINGTHHTLELRLCDDPVNLVDVFDDEALVAEMHSIRGLFHPKYYPPSRRPAHGFLILHPPTRLVAGVLVTDLFFTIHKTVFTTMFRTSMAGFAGGLDARLAAARAEVAELAALTR